MGLMESMNVVFSFLRGVYDCLPNAVRLLIVVSFGAFVFICVLKGVGKS